MSIIAGVVLLATTIRDPSIIKAIILAAWLILCALIVSIWGRDPKPFLKKLGNVDAATTRGAWATILVGAAIPIVGIVAVAATVYPTSPASDSHPHPTVATSEPGTQVAASQASQDSTKLPRQHASAPVNQCSDRIPVKMMVCLEGSGHEVMEDSSKKPICKFVGLTFECENGSLKEGEWVCLGDDDCNFSGGTNDQAWAIRAFTAYDIHTNRPIKHLTVDHFEGMGFDVLRILQKPPAKSVP